MGSTDKPKKRRHRLRRLVIVGVLGALVQRWLRPGPGGPPGGSPRSGGSWPPVPKAPGSPGPSA
ncbi:MAG TPA: hypothetical protein VN781_03980 [Acidimicrobiales bacterium]|nr:hypothetical protein [Acidimicrobiales bacterium]